MFVFFMSHGLLYYIFPEQHYTTGGGGWISYIKYLCLLVALPALLNGRFDRRNTIWMAIGMVVIIVPFYLQLYWINEGNLLLVQFQLACLGYFFGPYILRFFSKLHRRNFYLLAALIITYMATLGEIALGNVIGVYSISGFRSIGAFINPNNTGIVVAILAVIYHQQCKRTWLNVVIALLSMVTLIITGSKTAIAIYAIGVIAILPLNWQFFFLLAVPVGIIINIEKLRDMWLLLELREFSLESGEIRSVGVTNLLNTFSERSLSDQFFGFTNQSLIDNAYLDIMAYGGGLLLGLFLTVQFVAVAVCIRRRLWFLILLHGLFFLSMLSTNILRLWPTGYMYWALIGISMLKARWSAELFVTQSIYQGPKKV